MSCLVFCPYVFFSSFRIAITSLGEERAGLCAFRAFVCFAFVALYLFPIPFGIRDWLRHVIVALPGLFLYFSYIKRLNLRHAMTPGLRSEVQDTRECFALDPFSCWRSLIGTGIREKMFAIILHF